MNEMRTSVVQILEGKFPEVPEDRRDELAREVVAALPAYVDADVEVLSESLMSADLGEGTPDDFRRVATDGLNVVHANRAE